MVVVEEEEEVGGGGASAGRGAAWKEWTALSLHTFTMSGAGGQHMDGRLR